MGLGIFDFCTHSRRLISKDSISSPNFSCSCSYAERALWCRDRKRRALGNYIPMRIYYEYPISKCRGHRDLGLCTFWVLAIINPLSNGKIRFFLWAKRVFFFGSRFCSAVLFSQVPKKCTDLDLSLLYNLILRRSQDQICSRKKVSRFSEFSSEFEFWGSFSRNVKVNPAFSWKGHNSWTM